ncbi:hypothetical protein EZV62_008578 [Acer yangbiense]|uniref:Uncharacterized protein n=1 Tax=Acer yangbiense TaxID=1000413 RepID=A0A5C7ID99_9ROSI|nr:hypothetical protein EZV62_008578 [Acer yangbiense]
MAGGAAIRAAGKLTGMGVFNGGLRGGISAEQALRNVSRPAAAVVSTTTSSGAEVAAIQKASPEPIARVVFDVPPTLQEAKDATADLKEAVDKVYPESGVSKLASVPSSAYKAFKLLNDSPAVQSVVTSIVNDKKVQDAVMESNVLKEFMVSQRNNAAVEDQESHRMFDESSSDSSPGGDTAVKFGETEDGKVGDTEGPVKEYFQNVKKSVVEMVSNVSNFFQNLAERTPLMGMGLAIAVISVVVLKRV